MLSVIDELTPECLAIRIDCRLKAIDVIDVLSDLFIHEGARDMARDIATTDANVTSRRERKKVEMLFAHARQRRRDQRDGAAAEHVWAAERASVAF